MEIKVSYQLWVHSNTTIDGQGVSLRIIGQPAVLERVRSVILHNFEISGVPKYDSVHVFDGSTSMVWIDHVTSGESEEGLISVVQGSIDVTISNCHLRNHNFNMLLGASDGDTVDKNTRVTVYRNFFVSSKQRVPHCRWGYCHVVNNYYKNWGFYALGGRVNAQIYCESNVFEPQTPKEVTPWFRGFNGDRTATIESHGDLLLNGAKFTWFNHTPLHHPDYVKDLYYPPSHPTNHLATMLQNCAGVLGFKLNTCFRMARKWE
ncbi:hypothetical protein AMTRI_Chr13g85720 [Amborella trichopoda]